MSSTELLIAYKICSQLCEKIVIKLAQKAEVNETREKSVTQGTQVGSMPEDTGEFRSSNSMDEDGTNIPHCTKEDKADAENATTQPNQSVKLDGVNAESVQCKLESPESQAKSPEPVEDTASVHQEAIDVTSENESHQDSVAEPIEEDKVLDLTVARVASTVTGATTTSIRLSNKMNKRTTPRAKRLVPVSIRPRVRLITRSDTEQAYLMTNDRFGYNQPEPVRTHQCTTCRLAFESPVDFVKHIQQVHVGVVDRTGLVPPNQVPRWSFTNELSLHPNYGLPKLMTETPYNTWPTLNETETTRPTR